MPRQKTKSRISPGRAQDWISSVLNPIIEALRREQRFLPDGPWHWHHRARRLEYLHPIPEYVAEIYRDNYEDFLAKHRGFRKRFDEHDRVLVDLAQAVEAAFDRLMGHTGERFRDSLRSLLERKGIKGKSDVEYFVSYIAGNFTVAPGEGSLVEVYSAAADLRAEGEQLIEPEREQAHGAGKKLEEVSERLHYDLVDLRTELADRYGVRIRPVDPSLGY